MDDENLVINRAKNGDKSAAGELYITYFDPIYRYLFMKLSDRHEAEDLT